MFSIHREPVSLRHLAKPKVCTMAPILRDGWSAGQHFCPPSLSHTKELSRMKATVVTPSSNGSSQTQALVSFKGEG